MNYSLSRNKWLRKNYEPQNASETQNQTVPDKVDRKTRTRMFTKNTRNERHGNLKKIL